jgi:hypothetical protein
MPINLWPKYNIKNRRFVGLQVRLYEMFPELYFLGSTQEDTNILNWVQATDFHAQTDLQFKGSCHLFKSMKTCNV